MNCPSCNKQFDPVDGRGRTRKFCCLSCAGNGVGKISRQKIKLRQYQCSECDCVFEVYYKKRKFCSAKCYGKYYSKHAKIGSCGGKYDGNHFAILHQLDIRNIPFIDIAKVGRGVPDLIVRINGKIEFIEIKNPGNSYGKSGLNKLQKQFSDSWNGGKVNIVRCSQDIDNLMKNTANGLE